MCRRSTQASCCEVQSRSLCSCSATWPAVTHGPIVKNRIAPYIDIIDKTSIMQVLKKVELISADVGNTYISWANRHSLVVHVHSRNDDAHFARSFES